jgi:MFS family permease
MEQHSSRAETRAALPRNVRILGLASLINDIASEMIFPLLPTFLITVLGGNRFHLGVIEGLADSAASLLKLWSGGWSDRVGGRKAFVVVGYVMAAVTRPLIGLLVAPWQLLGVRFGDRIGKGIRAAPRDALIADSTSPELRGRAFGFNRAMDHLGAAIGPLLAAAFLHFWPGQYRPLFLLALLPGLVVAALVIFGLREAPAARSTSARLHLSLAPFGRDFRLYLVALVIHTLGNSSDAFLLVRAGELGVPVTMLPVLWTVFHIAKSTGNWLAGPAVDRVGPRPLILVGWFVYAAAYLAFGLATAPWHAWAFFLAYSLFYSLTEAAEKTLVANLAGSAQTGLAYGWFNFAVGIATLPASLIFGWIYERAGALPAFGWSAALASVAAVLLLCVRQPAGHEDGSGQI